MNNHRRLSRDQRQRLSLAIWMSFGSICLSLVLSIGVYLVVTKEQRRNCRATEALKLNDRIALEEDIASARQFLRDNPSGFPGFSADLIRDAIAKDERALARARAGAC